MGNTKDAKRNIQEMSDLASKSAYGFIESLAGLINAAKKTYKTEEEAKAAYNEAGTKCLEAYIESVTKLSVATCTAVLHQCFMEDEPHAD